MTGWQKQARATRMGQAWGAACLLAPLFSAGGAAAQIVAGSDGTFIAVAPSGGQTALM